MEQWSLSWSKAKTQKAKKEIEARIVRTLSERHQVLEVQKQRAETAKQKVEREELERLWTLPVKVGDKVKVLQGAGRQAGEIQEIRKDKFLVSLGGVLSAWMERPQFVHWDLRPGVTPVKQGPGKKAAGAARSASGSAARSAEPTMASETPAQVAPKTKKRKKKTTPPPAPAAGQISPAPKPVAAAPAAVDPNTPTLAPKKKRKRPPRKKNP